MRIGRAVVVTNCAGPFDVTTTMEEAILDVALLGKSLDRGLVGLVGK